jgi:hypothetical protein
VQIPSGYVILASCPFLHIANAQTQSVYTSKPALYGRCVDFRREVKELKKDQLCLGNLDLGPSGQGHV